ncbi:MAG: WYL domain-containing protein [Planctomycetota bacterium]
MRLSTRFPLERLVKIDQELRQGYWPNATSLAAALEVATRTILRDIEFMRLNLKAPIAYDAVHHGYFYTEADFRLPFFRISEGEYLALFLGERLLQAFGETPVAADLARFFAKVQAMLPESVTLDPQHLAESFSARPSTQALGDAQQFQALVTAIDRKQQLELVYWTASRDETCRRVVDPYHLASIDGEWFMIGYCHLREDVRTFSPGRIREMKPTGDSFDRPADFRIADYLDGGFRKIRGGGPPQKVRLRFSPALAPLIRERTWHVSQSLHDEHDGSVILTLKLTHLLEIKRWAMSWGSECEVLEPEELRQEIVRDLHQALRQLAASHPNPTAERSSPQ